MFSFREKWPEHFRDRVKKYEVTMKNMLFEKKYFK